MVMKKTGFFLVLSNPDFSGISVELWGKEYKEKLLTPYLVFFSFLGVWEDFPDSLAVRLRSCDQSWPMGCVTHITN